MLINFKFFYNVNYMNILLCAGGSAWRSCWRFGTSDRSRRGASQSRSSILDRHPPPTYGGALLVSLGLDSFSLLASSLD